MFEPLFIVSIGESRHVDFTPAAAPTLNTSLSKKCFDDKKNFYVPRKCDIGSDLIIIITFTLMFTMTDVIDRKNNI